MHRRSMFAGLPALFGFSVARPDLCEHQLLSFTTMSDAATEAVVRLPASRQAEYNQMLQDYCRTGAILMMSSVPTTRRDNVKELEQVAELLQAADEESNEDDEG